MLLSLLKDLASGSARRPSQDSAAAAATPATVPEIVYRRGGTIVALVPSSEGDALRQHTMEMLNPLRPHCSDVVVIDFHDPDWRSHFDAAVSRPAWFAMSPFGVGEVWPGETGPTSPWARAGVPFVRLFGDVPAYFPAKHTQHFPNSINAYGHAEHRDYFVRWFPVLAPCLLQPLFPFDALPRDAVDLDRKATSTRIIFPKNGNDPDRLVAYWREALPPSISRLLEAIAEETRAALDEARDLAGALDAHFATRALDISGCARLRHFLTAQLDDYLRRVKSTMIARSVLDLPVTVRGVHWEHVDFRGRRAMHDPDSDYTATRSLLDASTAVIDMSPNTHRGAHDRVLRAAGRYTAFLTNRSPFYVEQFRNADNFTYRFLPDSIRECVERALSRPRETVEMGLAQAERMREILTEEDYVDQLLTAVDACALACADRPPGTQDYVAFQALK